MLVEVLAQPGRMIGKISVERRPIDREIADSVFPRLTSRYGSARETARRHQVRDVPADHVTFVFAGERLTHRCRYFVRDHFLEDSRPCSFTEFITSPRFRPASARISASTPARSA